MSPLFIEPIPPPLPKSNALKINNFNQTNAFKQELKVVRNKVMGRINLE